jgi:hypothetical protein
MTPTLPITSGYAPGLPASPGSISLDGVPWYRNPHTLILLGVAVFALAAAQRVRARQGA